MIRRIIDSIRRNHALEHATISILLTRLGQHIRVMGRAAPDGFYIYGNISTERIAESAHEGLARLQRGEAHLAVSPLCGTNLAVAGILAGLASVLAVGSRNRLEKVPNAITAAMLAVLAAQPLGRLVQKYVTTSPHLDGMEIVSIQPMGKTLRNLHKVRTAFRSA
ncbi:MAG: hypothetical protein HYS09_01735 [Chloroflexi bacterium]|nr:hypothetical protein [Chloroflexota bacterium]